MKATSYRAEISITIPDGMLEYHENDTSGRPYHCPMTGDSYTSVREFVDHQIGRGLQWIRMNRLISLKGYKE